MTIASSKNIGFFLSQTLSIKQNWCPLFIYFSFLWFVSPEKKVKIQSSIDVNTGGKYRISEI